MKDTENANSCLQLAVQICATSRTGAAVSPDPPHKIEERLLTKEKAAENFDYFMGARLERVAYLQGRLQRRFGVTLTLDQKDVRALSRWGNESGFLLVKGANGRPTLRHFTYDLPWTGENTGHNVLFDMGITLGEAIIANCPKVHWDRDPSLRFFSIIENGRWVFRGQC